ncbi:hypothetical protein FRC03_001951 [Tulasnella sp. 419]|nr:hypothetical protein FRC03_001951 [Tulasnella sp. 419]
MGSVIAPLIGGFLAQPGERFPGIFGSFTLFIRFPYLLACMAGAGITLLGWLVGFFFLEESLGREQSKSTLISSHQNYGASSSRSSDRPTLPDPVFQVPIQHLSAKDILADMYVRRVLTSYTFLALVTVSIDAVLVLWLYTPLAGGGIGFTTAQIGVILSSIGILATLVNLFIFPPLQRNLGTIAIYRACFVIQAIIVALFPIIRVIATAEHRAKDSGIAAPAPLNVILSTPGPVTKMAVGIMVIFKSLGGMIFACNMILVSRASPSRMSLGAVNGLAQMVASSMRACGPTIATILFALSNDPQYGVMKRRLVWLYMFGLAFGGIFTSMRVLEGRTTGDSTDSTQ